MATLPEQLERLEAAVTRGGRDRALGARRRRGERDRRGVAARARARARSSRSSRWPPTRSASTRRSPSRGIAAIETDLAELIIQLADDKHVAHPRPGDPPQPGGDPRAVRAHDRRGRRTSGWEASAIAEAARPHLREKFLSVPVAVSGANFGVAETGHVCVVESEGNGRMCTTLPEALVTVMGIEKVLPEWRDLEVFLQLLPRSSTAERMNPYTSLWTGVRARRRPAGVPPRAARQRPHATCSPTRSAARRCTASAARRA